MTFSSLIATRLIIIIIIISLLYFPQTVVDHKLCTANSEDQQTKLNLDFVGFNSLIHFLRVDGLL